MMEKDMARQIREKIQAIMPQPVVMGMSETVFGMEEEIVGVKLNFSFFAASKVEFFLFRGITRLWPGGTAAGQKNCCLA